MRGFLLALLFRATIGLSVEDDIAGSVVRVSTPSARLSEVPPALASYVDAMHRGLVAANATQDCMAFALAYEFALRAQPARAPNRDVWDALRLGPDCGVLPPPVLDDTPEFWPPSILASPAGAPTFYVAPNGDDTGPGTKSAPFRTVQRGVNATRAARAPGTGPASIVLRAGIHVLGATVALDSRDDGLIVSNFPGEAAWVSGGTPLAGLAFTPVDVVPGGANIYAAHVPTPPPFLISLLTADGSGSPNKRLYRAQFPNFNPEWSATGACGGGPRAFSRPECVRDAAASPLLAALGARFASVGGDARAAWGPHGAAALGSPGLGINDPAILGWVKPGHFPTPLTYFRNLSGLGLKNDSIMTNYNLFSVGRGGACGLWTDAWPEDSSLGWDYQCGNITDGGWENIVDRLMNTLGQLNLPLGLVFNSTVAPNMANWSLDLAPADRVNGAAMVNVWHTQYWFTDHFYVTGYEIINATAGLLNLTADDGKLPAGGWQGGRMWETQGSFENGSPGGPLRGGGWWVENVRQELDSWDEFFYDVPTQTLFVFFNASYNATGPAQAPPPADLVLYAPQLEVFFNVTGAADVTLTGLGFRDQRRALMEPWVVPSGGDWALRPAGAVTLWNTTRATIANCSFLRTDSNAVFIGGRTRNTTVAGCEMAWIGMSAVAALGLTDFDDASGGDQPWGTLLSGLVVRELGLWEKQSSAYFAGRTPLTRVESCLFYNGPRAMVNVNDALHDGSNFTGNLMFNTCRESGDHGAMNSWDRMPFAQTLGSGGRGPPSYMKRLHSETSANFIIANYGSSQGFDNDDGSAYFHTHHNYFYTADGFKEDYGGHDAIFESNVVIVRAYDAQNCINCNNNYIPGHVNRLTNNTCAVQGGHHPWDWDLVMPSNGDGGWCGGPGDDTMIVNNNHYYTLHGNASVGGCSSNPWGNTLASWRAQPGYAAFEANSTAAMLPTAAEVVQWGRDVLGL